MEHKTITLRTRTSEMCSIIYPHHIEEKRLKIKLRNMGLNHEDCKEVINGLYDQALTKWVNGKWDVSLSEIKKTLLVEHITNL